LLNSVDIFAMPSEAELQSIATLEAMACGRPVLAANARALPELVEHGVNGFLFRAGDVEDAAQWMARLADQRERWAVMGAASLAKVRPHSLSNTFRRYRELYRSLLPGYAAQRTQQLSPTANQ
jgi:glycosyltransferase involved in cell wall biosynthesis